MRQTAISLATIVMAVLATSARAQVPAAPTGPSHALAPGRLEIAVAVGAHSVGWQGTDLQGVANVRWQPTASLAVGTDVGVGVTRHLLTHVGVVLTGYEDDMYWRPEVPHNPYLATATLLTIAGGLRWDIRDPRHRVRPYGEGGVVAVRFINIQRGPSEWCPDAPGIPSGGCFQQAPEIFTGTRLSGHFDAGMNFLMSPRWGFMTVMRVFRMQGSGTAPVNPADRPVGTDHFWHTQLLAGVLFRLP